MAGGMIIQDFDLAVLKDGVPVYEGTTNFGFFTAGALANQVGIRDSRLAGYTLPEELAAGGDPVVLPVNSPLDPMDRITDQAEDQVGAQPLSMPAKALLMVDKIHAFSLNGGLHGQGYILGRKEVDPKEWFFDAHFYQDPVCPGSLGVESFLQLIRYFILEKYEIDAGAVEVGLVPGHSHEWTYRGQIIPKNRIVDIHVHIKSCEQKGGGVTATADGALTVDGICIYEMSGFTLELNEIAPGDRAMRKKTQGRKKV